MAKASPEFRATLISEALELEQFSDSCTHGVPLLAAQVKGLFYEPGTACFLRSAIARQRAVQESGNGANWCAASSGTSIGKLLQSPKMMCQRPRP